MEPIDYASALRRSWRLLVGLGLLFGIIAALIPVSGKVAHPTWYGFPWRAITVVGSAPAGGSVLGGSVTGAQISFYATSASVEQTTASAVGIDPNVYYLRGLFSAAVVPPPPGSPKRAQSNQVRLTASGSTSGNAVDLANAWAQALDDKLTSVATDRQKGQASGSTPSTGYQVIQDAVSGVRLPSTIRTSAGQAGSRKVRGLVGLAVGLALGAAIVLLRELLDKRLRSVARAASTFDYPVVAEIPIVESADGTPEQGLVVVADPTSPAAEAYRMLRMSVLFERLAPTSIPTSAFDYLMQGGKGSSSPAIDPTELLPAPGPGARKVVLVVSPGTEPTRPQVAANLAAAYAEAGQRVIVISTADIEVGGLGEVGGNANGEIRPEDVESRLEPSSVEHLSSLKLRHFIDNSGQLVDRAPAVLDAARSLSDVVIIETLPLLAVHHAEALAHAVDVVLVVGECGSTTFDDARRSGDLLRRISAPVLGVVLTNVRLERRSLRRTLPRPEAESVAVTSTDGEATDPVDPGLSAAGAATTHFQA